MYYGVTQKNNMKLYMVTLETWWRSRIFWKTFHPNIDWIKLIFSRRMSLRKSTFFLFNSTRGLRNLNFVWRTLFLNASFLLKIFFFSWNFDVSAWRASPSLPDTSVRFQYWRLERVGLWTGAGCRGRQTRRTSEAYWDWADTIGRRNRRAGRVKGRGRSKRDVLILCRSAVVWSQPLWT